MKLPQLYLRDLFWLVLVVGMGVGWWLDRGRLSDSYPWLLGEVRRQGGHVQHMAEPPAGFPEQISVAEAESFLKTASTACEQGCGSGRWEGERWDTYVNSYESPVNTPWVERPVSLGSAFAYADDGHYLMYVTLDGVYYRRNSRSEPCLRWQQRWVWME